MERTFADYADRSGSDEALEVRLFEELVHVLNFYDDAEVGNSGHIFVSESDDDVDERSNRIDEAEASEVDDDNHMWSVVGPPPFTDDARRERPADHDQQTQGGLSKAKPPSSTRCPPLSAGDGSHIHSLGRLALPESTAVSRSEAADYALQYLPSVVKTACEKFEMFHGLNPGVASAEMIDAQSSLKVPGWASTHAVDWSFIDSERKAYEPYVEEQSVRQTNSCYAFGNADTASGAQ